MMLVYVATTHDVNGNPRRGWVQLDGSGDRVRFYDEGYAGRGALPNHLRDGASWDPLRITPGEYRRLLKLA